MINLTDPSGAILADRRRPSVFDWRRYIKDHPDLQRALNKNRNPTYADATCHYLNHGLRERRRAYVLGTNEPYIYDFDWKMYDKLNPDVFTERNRGENVGKWHCFRHWCEYGYKENRKTTTEQQLSVNNDVSISSGENINKQWRNELTKLDNNNIEYSIDDLIKFAGDIEPNGKTNIIIVSSSVNCKILFDKYYNINSFDSQDTSNIVVIWNIDTNDNRRLFDYRKNKQLPVFCIERGCLPNTIYIDDNESIYKTNKFTRDLWDTPLSKKEHDIITKYIQEIRGGKYAVEKQKIENISNINTKGFNQIIFCPLQRIDDTSITRYGGWVNNVNNFYSIVQKLSKRFANILFLMKSHPTEILQRRYKDETTNFKFVDKYHVNDIIELCDKVLLINSGVGIFSMMFNKPCGILGQSFYHIRDVNMKIDNEHDIVKFIENTSTKVSEQTALRYLYYLKFKYLYDAVQRKDETTNNKTIFKTNNICFHVKRVDLLYKNTKLNINHVLFGPRCSVFDNILSKFEEYMANYKHIVSGNFDETCDIFIIWRLRQNSPIEFKTQWLDIPKIRDNSYIYLHESIDSTRCIPGLSFDERKPLFALFNKFICTSMQQYNILKNNLPNAQIYYSPLASINNIPRSLITNTKKTIGFIGYEYANDIKNFALFKDIISTFDSALIKLKVVTNGYKRYIDDLINMGFEVHVSNSVTDIDILIITSKSEGSPIPVYECLQNNVHCMSTCVGNVNEILHSNYIYNSKDEGIKVLHNILNNIDTINTFKNREFTWELTRNKLTEILNENCVYFKINDPTSNLLFISYGTINTKYSDNIKNVCEYLTRHKYNYYIETVPNYGGWKNNTYVKASWILDVFMKFTYNIMWFDMDSYILRRFIDVEPDADVCIPSLEHWNAKYTHREFLSGLLYFKKNTNAHLFLETWIRMNCVYYSKHEFEQNNLINAYHKLKALININIDFFTHRELYIDLYRKKFPFCKPNIYQLQFSRVTKHVVYASMHQELLKEYIITNRLSEIYQNEIYIIGGGPSISDFDKSRLKDKFVIGINSVIFLEKELGIKFSAFVSIDNSFLTMYRSKLDAVIKANPSLITIFYQNMTESDSIKPYINNENLFYHIKKNGQNLKIEVGGMTYSFTNNILEHIFPTNNKFSTYEPITSGAASILIAAHMGFTNINLIGFDGNISNRSHYSTLYEDSNRKRETFRGHIFNNIHRVEEDFIKLFKICDNLNINFLTPTSYKISKNM